MNECPNYTRISANIMRRIGIAKWRQKYAKMLNKQNFTVDTDDLDDESIKSCTFFPYEGIGSIQIGQTQINGGVITLKSHIPYAMEKILIGGPGSKILEHWVLTGTTVERITRQRDEIMVQFVDDYIPEKDIWSDM